jgi:hypothetical protein
MATVVVVATVVIVVAVIMVLAGQGSAGKLSEERSIPSAVPTTKASPVGRARVRAAVTSGRTSWSDRRGPMPSR